MLSAIIVIICAYVSGSIPTGYWVVKSVKGIDIRTFGSGSTGATNVLRCLGRGWGAFVFFTDILKGFAPVFVAVNMDRLIFDTTWNFAYPHLIPMVAAVAALVGHSRSIFLKFQGGKSAATGLGCLIALCPPGGFCTFVTWITVLGVSRYVSLASILGVASCPFWFYYFHAPATFIGFCVFGFIYVTYRHKANVKRLFQGTEPKIGSKSETPQTQGQSETAFSSDTTSNTTCEQK